MPTYNFIDKTTEETFSDFMSISEMETYLSENPHIQLIPSAPLIHSGRGLKKPEQGFRDLLKDMKRKHRGADINTF